MKIEEIYLSLILTTEFIFLLKFATLALEFPPPTALVRLVRHEKVFQRNWNALKLASLCDRAVVKVGNKFHK